MHFSHVFIQSSTKHWFFFLTYNGDHPHHEVRIKRNPHHRHEKREGIPVFVFLRPAVRHRLFGHEMYGIHNGPRSLYIKTPIWKQAQIKLENFIRTFLEESLNGVVVTQISMLPIERLRYRHVGNADVYFISCRNPFYPHVYLFTKSHRSGELGDPRSFPWHGLWVCNIPVAPWRSDLARFSSGFGSSPVRSNLQTLNSIGVKLNQHLYNFYLAPCSPCFCRSSRSCSSSCLLPTSCSSPNQILLPVTYSCRERVGFVPTFPVVGWSGGRRSIRRTWTAWTGIQA